MVKFVPKACQTFLRNIAQIQTKAKNFDPNSVTDMVSKVFSEGLKGHKPNALSMLNEFVINGMLSGTGTPIANALSGVIQTIAIPFVNLIKSLPKGTAARREARAAFSALSDGWASDMVFFNGGFKTGLPYDFQLSYKNMNMGKGEFVDAMKAAGVAVDVDGNIDPKYLEKLMGESYDFVTKAIPGPLGEIIRIPTKLTVAADEYFKGRLRSQHALALLSRKASLDEAKGLGDYDTLYKQYKSEVFKDGDPKGLLSRLEKIFEGQDDFATAIADVRNYATDGTFQTKLTGLLQQVQNLRGEGKTLLGTGVIQAIPFLRTPWNILKEGASYTPGLGFAMRPGRTKATANLVEGEWKVTNEVVKMPLEDMVARQLVGFTMAATVFEMFNNGLITGSLPEDPAERERWKANGIQPNSIKAGDQWISYARAEPFATVLGLSSDILEYNKRVQRGEISGDLMTERGRQDTEKALFSSLKSNILQKSFMQGFADAIGVIDSPEGLKSYFDSLAKRMVPAISNTVARGFDRYEREAVTTLEKMQQRIPGLREQLPVQYNKYGPEGENVPAETNMMQAWTGIAVKQDPTKFQKKMDELGVAFKAADRKIEGVALTSEQYSFYKKKINELAGVVFKQNIDSWLADPNRNMIRAGVEQRIMPKITEAAKKQLFAQYPDLLDKIIQAKQYNKGLDVQPI